jgi:hypothetical protein
MLLSLTDFPNAGAAAPNPAGGAAPPPKGFCCGEVDPKALAPGE